MKLILLIVSLLLMFAVIGIGLAGLVWLSNSSVPTRVGGQFVLSIASLAALSGLLIIWIGRPKPSH